METERIPINIEDEMKNSYLDYAMSVIIGRALPDVRDGLKPVHRRVLYAMHEMGLNWNKPFKKSARVVGDVMGKYHPHGDAAIYDTLVRMAQDFAMRSTLVDGQGNFGTIDDPPAAMRYTEARMSRISQEMLADIEKETVDFMPNYDNSTQEPKVLPARLPNLLLNGSSGIAVGMATNIPPHNLSELVKGVVILIDRPETSIGELMEHIKGPDFPTGAFICGTTGIRNAYSTGRGSITLRARAQIEEMKDREVIVVTELPYQVSKAGLLQKIAELIKTKKIEGISDLRDESDREGLRIVIELKRNEIAKAILNKLYKHTALQNTFGVIMLAIVHGRPQVLNLKEMLQLFIRHRYEVVVRRTKYDLAQAEDRLHILEGLTKALENLDAVIRLIRKSASPEDAREGLKIQFGLSQKQAQAVLDMKLQKLTGLEREKLLEEHQETLKTVENLKAILASDVLVRLHIKQEIEEIGKKYGDARRTAIIDESTEIALEEMIAEEDMVVTITHRGYLKRSALNLYRIQRRSGVGVKGVTPKEEDFVEHMFVSSTHDYILFFTDAGRVYWLKVHEIPQAGRQAKGTAVANLLKLSSQETITAVLPVRTFDSGKYIMMATRNGTVKKTPLDAFSNPRQGGIIAISLDEGDKLIAAKLADGNQQIFIGTRHGMASHFNEQEVRSMGRPAQGVIGIKLRDDDEVIGMEVVNPGTTILTVTDRGFGKRTLLSEYSTTHRGCHGVINVKLTEKNGQVVGIKQVGDEESVMIITASGTLIWIKVKGISLLGRATMGVKLQSMDQEDKVVAIAGIAEGAEGTEEAEGEAAGEIEVGQPRPEV